MKEYTISSLSKLEIAEMLKYYCEMIDCMKAAPNIPCGTIYESILMNENVKKNKNYYNSMCRVAYDMILVKKYSITVDWFIHLNNKILNDELDIDDIKKEIFIDENSIKQFSNKEVCLYIRHAFNHNPKNKDLYRISRNGKFIEIYLEFDDRSPFHIKMNIDQFSELLNRITNVGRDILTTEFNLEGIDFSKKNDELYEELSKVKFKKRYFSGKFNLDLINELNDFLKEDFNSKQEVKDGYEKWTNHLKTLNQKQEEFNLDEAQRRVCVDKIQYMKDNFSYMYAPAENFFVRKAMLDSLPIGILNSNQLDIDSLFNNFLVTNKATYNLMIDFVKKSLFSNNENIPNEYFEKLEQYIKKSNPTKKDKLETYIDFLNSDLRTCNVLLIYYEYLLKNLCTEEELEGDLRNIRNSITHGRYFLGQAGNIELYDRSGKGVNDYKYKFHTTLKFEDIYKSSKEIYNNLQENQKINMI